MDVNRSVTWGKRVRRLAAQGLTGGVVMSVAMVGSTGLAHADTSASDTGGPVSTVVDGVTGLLGTTVNDVTNTALSPVANKFDVAGPTTLTTTTNAPLGLSDVERSIGADQSIANGYTGKGVDVAVLDSGVTPVPGLDGPNQVVYGPDLSFDSQNPATADVDGFGHGTSMASLIVGNDGTTGGFTGVAPGARVVSVKVGASNGAVDVSQIIAGIDWVTQHAHTDGLNIRVLSLSLGTDSLQPYQIDPLAHAAEVAWRSGIVVVAAVGNQGNDDRSVTDPATDPYLLDVGAADPNGTVTTSDDVVTTFSNGGNRDRHADLVAPGAYIAGLRDPGSTLDVAYPDARIGSRFFRGSGTSQATAITAGAVADLLSQDPTLTPDQVKTVLMRSADTIATTNRQLVGAGELDLAAAENQRVPRPGRVNQNYPQSNGLGSLDAARGDAHITVGTDTLTGEQDIFGNRWSNGIARAEERGTAWNGGTFNGATWSGATWSSATWSGATWSGATWSGATWSGATWSGATWSSATWSSATWSSATWSSATWSSATWSGATWSGATWS